MPPKDVERMANSVDPNQTAPDKKLHCLLMIYVPIFRIFTVARITSLEVYTQNLSFTLLHSERPKGYEVLAVLSAIGLN